LGAGALRVADERHAKQEDRKWKPQSKTRPDNPMKMGNAPKAIYPSAWRLRGDTLARQHRQEKTQMPRLGPRQPASKLSPGTNCSDVAPIARLAREVHCLRNAKCLAGHGPKHSFIPEQPVLEQTNELR